MDIIPRNIRFPSKPTMLPPLRITLINSVYLTILLLVQFAATSSYANVNKKITKEQLGILKMDMNQLLETEILVTSVSKRPQELHKTASAVHVISQEDIERSGAVNLMEAIRIAPGVQVSKINQNTYTVSVRGFNQRRGANKLLVLLDGRSVYSPAFSQVVWIGQDVMLEDVDRIEVIRGPGAALWGSNAVAGVINIITKPSDQTQGNLLSGGIGTEENGFAAYRYGGTLESGLTYRAYGKYRDRDDGVNGLGDRAFDEKEMGQIGFRADWEESDDDYLTVQGDAYYLDSETDYPSAFISSIVGNKAVKAGLIQKGGNLLTRWTRELDDDSKFKLQLYYDNFSRDAQKIVQNTNQKFDLDFQYDFSLEERHLISWGLNYQYQLFDFGGNVLEIKTQDAHLSGFFIHDEIALIPDKWNLILGSKFEHNEFSGFEFQPNIRMVWTPGSKHTYWGAVSRAVRIPSPRSEDATVQIFSSGGGGPSLLREEEGDTNAENLIAYEIGYKYKHSSNLYIDISTFLYDYTDLINATSTDGLITRNANALEGNLYGFELVGKWQPIDSWRISGNYSFTKVELNSTKSTLVLSAFNAEDEPEHRIALNSFYNITKNIQFDTSYYYVSGYSGASIPEFHRIDLRLGWKPLENLDVSLMAQNIGDASHQEFNDGFERATETQRGFYAKLTTKF